MSVKKISNQETLSMVNSHYHLLIDNLSQFGVFLLDFNGKIILLNQGAENVLGFKQADILGKNLNLIFENDNGHDYLKQALKKSKLTGSFEEDVLLKRKDGSQLWANCAFSVIHNNNPGSIFYSILLKDITDKKRREDLLTKSEEKYRLLVHGVRDYAIYMINTEGNIVSWNIGAERLKGYSAEEVIGKHFSIFYPEQALEEGFPQYEIKQAKDRGSYENEGIRVRKDGSEFYANVVLTSIYNSEKQLIGYTKITKDITLNKQAEENLKKSEEKNRMLIEGVRDYAIFMLSPEGYIESWNEGAKRFKGYSEREAIGKHFSIFYPKEARDKGFPEFELEQAKKRGRFEDEGWRVRKDGTLFYANVIITAMFGKDKRLIGFSKITRDLSERKEAEELLRRSEEKHRLLTEAVKDYAIYMLDPEGHVASWNEGARRLKGYSEREITGRHFSIFYPEDKKKEGYPDYELEQAKKRGRYEDEGFRVRKDGSLFYANVIITALFNSNKELIGFSKITRDLTERKQAEENMAALNKDLEKRVKERTEELNSTVIELKKINMDLDNFIYTASHDLKAPVSNIEGLMNTLQESLQQYGFINDEISGFMEMINKSISRFQTTIRDLASVNESQRTDRLDLTEINLAAAIEDVMSSIDHLIKESKAKIIIDIDNTSVIRFSRTHIRSIIYNLLTNSLKYHSPDRPLVISIKSYMEDNYYIIEVTDNGLGIKEENKGKIFQMFKRLHDHVEGSGIGLYIVRRIVDNNGGKIEVNSEVNKGTTFKVFLPKG